MKTMRNTLFAAFFALLFVSSFATVVPTWAVGDSDTPPEVIAAQTSDATVSAAGDITIHVDPAKVNVGDTVELVIYSATPKHVVDAVVQADYTVTVTSAQIQALGLTGNHELAVRLNGAVIAAVPVVLNEDGSVNVDATVAAIEAIANTSSKDMSPLVPAGLAVLVVAVAGGVVIARKKVAVK